MNTSTNITELYPVTEEYSAQITLGKQIDTPIQYGYQAKIDTYSIFGDVDVTYYSDIQTGQFETLDIGECYIDYYEYDDRIEYTLYYCDGSLNVNSYVVEDETGITYGESDTIWKTSNDKTINYYVLCDGSDSSTPITVPGDTMSISSLTLYSVENIYINDYGDTFELCWDECYGEYYNLPEYHITSTAGDDITTSDTSYQFDKSSEDVTYSISVIVTTDNATYESDPVEYTVPAAVIPPPSISLEFSTSTPTTSELYCIIDTSDAHMLYDDDRYPYNIYAKYGDYIKDITGSDTISVYHYPDETNIELYYKEKNASYDDGILIASETIPAYEEPTLEVDRYEFGTFDTVAKVLFDSNYWYPDYSDYYNQSAELIYGYTNAT